MAVVKGREAKTDVRPRATGEGEQRQCCLGEVAGDVIEAEGEEEVEKGARRTVKVHDPKEPSEEERTEHALTHFPFRRWCS